MLHNSGGLYIGCSLCALRGEYITVTRRDDGSYSPNFRPIHTGPGFNVTQYATDVANELLWALGGLVEEE